MFTFKKETNLEIGQGLYGIVGVSRYTYDGVRKLVVDAIDWDNETVIFVDAIEHTYVACSFADINEYAFENEEEANQKLKTLDFGLGMYAW